MQFEWDDQKLEKNIENHGPDKEHPFGHNKRMFKINLNFNNDYFVGLFLTIKDHKKFCQLKNESGKLTLKVSSTDPDANLMDFNFFAIHKQTGAGIYQHYHQSCSLNQFCIFLQNRFRDYKDMCIKSDYLKLADPTNEKEQKKVRAKYSNDKFNHSMILREEDFIEILNEFEKINSFEFNYSILHSEEQNFSMLKDMIQTEKIKVLFKRDTHVSILASAISGIKNKLSIKKGTVSGKDSEGKTRVIDLIDNPNNFGEYEFDEVASELDSLDVNKFESSWLVTEILKICKANEYFLKHIK